MEKTRPFNAAGMNQVVRRVLPDVAGTSLSRDGAGRKTDIAFDHSQFTHMPAAQIAQTLQIMRGEGVSARRPCSSKNWSSRSLPVPKCATGWHCSMPMTSAALPWTTDAADQCGDIAAHLQKSGQVIGEMDTLIAAHALAEGLILVTHNTRHFERIPDLKLEDWMA